MDYILRKSVSYQKKVPITDSGHEGLFCVTPPICHILCVINVRDINKSANLKSSKLSIVKRYSMFFSRNLRL